MSLLRLRLESFSQILRHFENPFLVTLLRLGWLRIPLFQFRIRCLGTSYRMVGRPVAERHADLSILRTVLVEEEYHAILALLPKGPVRLVDIGANLGSFTVWISRRHGLKEAFCFEPEPGSFQLCRFNLAQNGCDTANLAQKAVGGEKREIEMWADTTRPGSVNIYGQPSRSGSSQVRVEVLAFRDWLATVDGQFDLLKMDCEGAEWEILRATPAEQLRRFAVIVAELHEDPVRKTPIADFRATFEEAGFETVRDDNRYMGLFICRRKD